MPACDHPGHRRNQPGRVLVVRMYHDDDIGAGSKGLQVAGFLVASVPTIARMHQRTDAEILRQCGGRVGRRVIGEQHGIHDVLRQVIVGRLQSLTGVIGGHDHDDPHAIEHDQLTSWSGSSQSWTPD